MPQHTRLVFLLVLIVCGQGNQCTTGTCGNFAILLLGNPGTGKSFLGNNLCETNVFETGTAQERITAKFQQCQHGDVTIMDVPGLLDLKNIAQNKLEVKKALQQNRDYIIMYILTLEEGRVRYQDITLLKILAEVYQFESKQLVVVFNKEKQAMPEEVMAKYVLYIGDETNLRFDSATFILDHEAPDSIFNKLSSTCSKAHPVFIDAFKVKDLKLEQEKIEEQLHTEKERQIEQQQKLQRLETDKKRLQAHADSLKKQGTNNFLKRITKPVEKVIKEVTKPVEKVIKEVKKILKKLCFSPNTLLWVGNTTVEFKNIKIGTLDEFGNKIYGLLQFQQALDHKIYKYNDIFVSGNQAVLSNDGTWTRVKNDPRFELDDSNFGILYDVAIEGHEIYVGKEKVLFKDAEETQSDVIDDIVLNMHNKK